jgi:hypothetical protein
VNNEENAAAPGSCSTSGVLATSKKSPTGGSSGLTGNAGGSWLMSFMPIHWITYFSDSQKLQYVLVAMSVSSGNVGDGSDIASKMKCTVSTYGMFLQVSCKWPSLLHNFNALALAWKKKYNNKLSVNLNTFMFFSAQLQVNKMKVATKVAAQQSPVAVAKFKLSFEVERVIVSMLPILDINHGVVLQVIMKEQAKKFVEQEWIMEMVQVVSRSFNANSEFDCSTLSKRKKRRVENPLAAVVAPVATAAVEIVCINSQGDDSSSTGDSNY